MPSKEVITFWLDTSAPISLLSDVGRVCGSFRPEMVAWSVKARASRPNEIAVRRRTQLQAEMGEPFGKRREPDQAVEAPAGHTGRDAPHEYRAARVARCDLDISRDDAREVVAVAIVKVLALLEDHTGPVDV